MKQKTGIILIICVTLIIFFGILGFLQYKMTSGVQTQNETSTNTKGDVFEVFSVEKNDITSLSITNASGKLNFGLEDGKWVCLDDKSISLNQRKLSALIDSLRVLKASQVLEGHSASEYGLNNPSYKYILETGDISFEFAFGISNPVTGDVYCMIDGIETFIYTCPSEILNLLNTDLNEYK